MTIKQSKQKAAKKPKPASKKMIEAVRNLPLPSGEPKIMTDAEWDAAPSIVVSNEGLKINYVSPSTLIPYVRNARKHSPEQVQLIAASIKEFGWTNPILTDGNSGILAGHGRLQAAQLLGLSLVPTIDLAHLSDAQKRAYIIADNEHTLRGEWDLEKLQLELTELKDLDFNLDLLGFPEDELDKLMTPEIQEGLTDDDAVPEALATATSMLGDVWICGDHRIMCGDSTQLAMVEQLMNGQRADLIFTDPPYGVSFEQGKTNPRAGKNFRGKEHKIANDELRDEDLTAYLKDVLINCVLVSKNAPVYVWAPCLLEGGSIGQAVKQAGIHIQNKIIWRKHPFVMGRSDYHWQHEECWYGFIGQNHPWYGGRDKGTVWDVNRLQKVELHPTQKPVELAEIAINNSSKGGDIVLDVFGGSGFTLIGAEKLGRRAFIMEIAPTYVDTMVRRWQEYTGKAATLESDGRSFADVCTTRGVVVK